LFAAAPAPLPADVKPKVAIVIHVVLSGRQRSKILPQPFVLHGVAPIADVPLAPGTKAAERILTSIDREVEHAQSIVGMGLLESFL